MAFGSLGVMPFLEPFISYGHIGDICGQKPLFDCGFNVLKNRLRAPSNFVQLFFADTNMMDKAEKALIK
jgi:hypothetical protein